MWSQIGKSLPNRNPYNIKTRFNFSLSGKLCSNIVSKNQRARENKQKPIFND